MEEKLLTDKKNRQVIEIEENIKIGKRAMIAAKDNVVKSAGVADLVYVSDKEPGFTRHKNGDDVHYLDGKKRVTAQNHLDRIKKLVIPPAWEKVWICKLPNGHLQATGFDKLGRKQYLYHPRWNILRNNTKFYSLLKFGQQLPSIRRQLHKGLTLQGYPQEKVLAAIVSLLDRTNIRIGNEVYEKLYGSFGLTTMNNKHVTIQGSSMNFSFKGKKGIKHKITLRSKKLSRIVKGCRDIPGKKLFEYYDENGDVHTIDSGMVNNYIHNIAEDNFTAKDFRTWSGSVQALIAFREIGDYATEPEKKQKINTALDMVAKQLGNTRAVCKKYYIHPAIIDLYESKKLMKYFGEADEKRNNQQGNFTETEKTLLKILERC